MKKSLLLMAALAAIACNRSDDVEGTDTELIGGDVDIGLTTDTVNVPTFSTEKDTLIVDKPVISGRKPVEVKRPEIQNRP